MTVRVWVSGAAIAVGLGLCTPALAAPKDTDSDSESASDSDAAKDDAGDAENDGDKDADADKDESDGDRKSADAEGTKVEASDADASPVEEAGKTYHFVGARYRLIVVPQFMISMFADGGATVAVHSAGPEFVIRKDNFEYNLGLWLAGYGMDPTPFKSKSDGEDAWELVESRIKVLYATADFIWSKPLSKEFAWNYGMGAGIGFVFGSLYRNQAYRGPNGTFVACPSKGFVLPACGNDNDHYDNYNEPNWFNSGSKPAFFPWLAVQTGLRYKPHRRFVARLDVGFGLTGFFFGLGADYGL